MGFDEFLDSWNSLPRLDDIQAATGYRMTFKEVSATGATELNDDSGLHLIKTALPRVWTSACRPYENQPVADTQKPPRLIYSPGGLL